MTCSTYLFLFRLPTGIAWADPHTESLKNVQSIKLCLKAIRNIHWRRKDMLTRRLSPWKLHPQLKNYHVPIQAGSRGRAHFLRLGTYWLLYITSASWVRVAGVNSPLKNYIYLSLSSPLVIVWVCSLFEHKLGSEALPRSHPSCPGPMRTSACAKGAELGRPAGTLGELPAFV